jgi:hypothetical protein
MCGVIGFQHVASMPGCAEAGHWHRAMNLRRFDVLAAKSDMTTTCDPR